MEAGLTVVIPLGGNVAVGDAARGPSPSTAAEYCLRRHPAVADAAVIRVPDGRGGRTGKALVALRPEAICSERALIAFCQERVARHLCPTSIEFTSRFRRRAG